MFDPSLLWGIEAHIYHQGIFLSFLRISAQDKGRLDLNGVVCYGATGVTGGPKNPRTEATLAGKIIQMGRRFQLGELWHISSRLGGVCNICIYA